MEQYSKSKGGYEKAFGLHERARVLGFAMTFCSIDGHRRMRGGPGWALKVMCVILNCRCVVCNQRARTAEDEDES